MRLQRVEPSGIPTLEGSAQPEAEEYVRWGRGRGDTRAYTQKCYKNGAGEADR